MKKNIILSIVYFLSSTIITWWFIKQEELLYFSKTKMILSCSIAGAKWGIQIIAALIFLKENKWEFIKRIAFVCLVGSCILLPYCIFEFLRYIDKSFLISLITAVTVMIIMYYTTVQQLQINKSWFWSWLLCLCIAISLQLFVVFKIA